MTKEPPAWKTMRDLMDLVYLAEVNFLICKTTYLHLDRQKRIKGYDYFLMSANNAFNETIGILHTLLCSTKKEEIRMEPRLKEVIERDKKDIPFITDEKAKEFSERLSADYPRPNYSSYTFLQENDDRLIGDIMADIRKKKRVESGLEDIKKLKGKFEGFNFHKIRHQAIAHKNKHLESPAGAAIGLIKETYIENLGEVIKELKLNAYFWFDYTLINPYIFITVSLTDLIKPQK